jgi:hypothetical protein
MISAPKIISALYLVFSLIVATTTGVLEPIKLYESVVDNHALFDQVPGPVMAVMLHMAVAVCLVFVLCAITIFVTTWYFEASKTAMFMGMVFWGMTLVSQAIVPRPSSVLVPFGIQMPELMMDLIPFVFCGIFLFGYLYNNDAAACQANTNTTKNKTSTFDDIAWTPTMLSKLWSIGYLLILVKASGFWTSLVDPPSFLMSSVSTEGWEATPVDVQMAMNRAIFLFCALHLMAAVGTLISVVMLNRQKATFMFLVSMYFWMIRLVYIHLAYPWPNEILGMADTQGMFIEGACVLGSITSLLAELILGTLAARARKAENRSKTKRD